MSALIRPIDAILPRASRNFGGKARNLAALARAGFPVPMAYALSCEAATRSFEAALAPEDQPAHLFAGTEPSDEQLARVREQVLAMEMPEEVVSALDNVWSGMREHGVESVAVRSSSVAEDQAAVSAAGMHTSELNVSGPQELRDAVKRCWASVFQPRVVSYLSVLGADAVSSIGVVVQAMVGADVSGVLFTVNPLTANPDEMVINASYGLGTAIMDGEVTPDTYRIDKRTRWVRDRVLGDKHIAHMRAHDGGTRSRAVTAREAARLVLDDHTLEQIVSLGLRVEDHFGDPRDIEWALAGETLYLLQARPVTALRPAETRRRPQRKHSDQDDPRDWVWSNINVGEALPGVATPLTWSVLSGFSELGFHRAFAALGCTMPKNATLVGNFRGRIYLNLSELSRIASQVPGITPQRVLPLGGGAQVARLQQERESMGSTSFMLRLPFTVSRFVREHAGIRGRIDRFEEEFASELGRIRGLDLRILPSASLDETLLDAERMLDDTGSLTLTVYGGLLSSMLTLQTALRFTRGDDAERLQQDLLSNLEMVESADPGRLVESIATHVRADAALVERFTADPPPRSLSVLPPGPVRVAAERLLEEHGHRGVREAEFSEPRWAEDPSLLLQLVGMHLRADAQGRPGAMEARMRERRRRADAVLRDMLPPVRKAVEGLLNVVRYYMRLRERMRSQVVRVLGLYRWIALDASRRMLVREPSVGRDAAFYLTIEELHAYLRGEVRTVAMVTTSRRAQYARDQALPSPPDTFVGEPGVERVRDDSAQSLDGLAASGGNAEGVVRVLQSSADISRFQPGEILVVRSADVGWAPLFRLAGGLVTEVGGPLSHACVVAREYGLPAVVNVAGATRILCDGERIALDGDKGSVRRLDA